MAISIEEYRELQKEKKKPRRKYRNIKVEACPECWYELKTFENSQLRWCENCRINYCPGQFIIFDSKAEWEHGLMLKKRENRGEIVKIFRQTQFEKVIDKKRIKLPYKIDFTFFDSIIQEYRLHEVKGLNKKTGKPYIQGTLKEFRRRCLETKSICPGNPDVQIFAGGIEFRFDKKGKLIRVL